MTKTVAPKKRGLLLALSKEFCDWVVKEPGLSSTPLVRRKGRQIVIEDGSFELRERASSFAANFEPENEVLMPKRKIFQNDVV